VTHESALEAAGPRASVERRPTNQGGTGRSWSSPFAHRTAASGRLARDRAASPC